MGAGTNRGADDIFALNHRESWQDHMIRCWGQEYYNNVHYMAMEGLYKIYIRKNSIKFR